MNSTLTPWLGIVSLLLLAGCGTVPMPAPGTSAAEVRAQWGEPTVSCPSPEGGASWVWSRQPAGTEAWAAQMDAAGRVLSFGPVLTDEAFARLASGTWSREQVRCHFGPPAEVSRVGLPSQRQEVWSYRYRREGVWPALMHVYLGPEGEQVTRFHSGPDPLVENWRWAF